MNSIYILAFSDRLLGRNTELTGTAVTIAIRIFGVALIVSRNIRLYPILLVPTAKNIISPFSSSIAILLIDGV